MHRIEDLYALVDNLPIPAAVTAVADDRVLRLSGAFAEVFGRDPSSTVGRPAHELHSDPCERQSILDRLESGETVAATLRGADDVPHSVEVVARRVDTADGPALLQTFHDVTRLERMEAALRTSEKMATLGTLSAGVAHELNNPATAAQRGAEQLERAFEALQAAYTAVSAPALPKVTAAALTELDDEARRASATSQPLDPVARSDREVEVEEWLERSGVPDAWEAAPALVDIGIDSQRLAGFPERFGEQAGALANWMARSYTVYRLLHEIRHGAGRLSEIVGALKAYSYVGQAPVKDVDVNEEVRNTLVILRNKLKRGIEVRDELDETIPHIEARGSELTQVWTNILDNAADALDGTGTITLRSSSADGWVRVDIEDDGPGIPPDVQPRVFEAFFTTKPPGKGLGLGLNTAYDIVVSKHGGRMSLDSEPGRTAFVVELPTTLPAADTKEE